MGIFLDVAYKILREKGEPLSAKDIVELAINNGELSTKGMTPSQTMKSKLSTDILRRGDKSRFMRAEQGKFALRMWADHVTEFTADRFQKALFDEDIVVFPASDLPLFVPGPGLTVVEKISNYSHIFKNMRRREAEADVTVIQLVSVFIIRHKSRILTYKRTKRLPESRLHDFYSLAFGGHLNPDDVTHLFNILDPSQGLPWLLRELGEEVKLRSLGGNRVLYRGLLYDSSRSISRQHLGITYEVLVDNEEFKIGERGFLMDAKFEDVNDIRQRKDQFENWSLLLLDKLGGQWI